MLSPMKMTVVGGSLRSSHRSEADIHARGDVVVGPPCPQDNFPLVDAGGGRYLRGPFLFSLNNLSMTSKVDGHDLPIPKLPWNAGPALSLAACELQA